MNKKMSVAVMGAVAVSVVVVFVSASPLMADTPLYTLRMEQHSSKMSFLPTAVNGFTYITEGGHTVSCDVAGYCGGVLRGTDATCHPTCDGWTCDQTGCQSTCDETCPNTCSATCPATCPNTCSTCQGQGFTCDDTSCQDTCEQGTCSPTCPYTCGHTCGNTCGATCPITCGWTECYLDTCQQCPIR